MPEDDDKLERLIKAGGDIAGPATGSALGFLIGGPGGAAIGGAVGVAVSKVVRDVANRVLSDREQTRVGATVTFALAQIKSRLDSGYKLRDDGFFETKDQERSGAEEIFEGVLLKAKNEHEEKKNRILGNIFANTAFTPDFSIGESNHLLRVAENITYRQMCTLALLYRKSDMHGIMLRSTSYGYPDRIHDPIAPHETVSSLQETFDLYRLGLVVCVDKSDESRQSIWAITEWNDITPDSLELTRTGQRYCHIMGLEVIPQHELNTLAAYFS